MDEKIIIVRVKEDVSQPIKYLEESLNSKASRYYSVNYDDSSVVADNNGLNCLVAFVIYRKSDKEHYVSCIYLGNGSIRQNEVRWVIEYTILKKKTSRMFIDNFVSNSELDLQNDFELHSFVNIEAAPDLIEQVSFVMKEPYRIHPKPITDQIYPKLELETNLHEYSQFNEHCKRPIGKIAVDEDRPEYQRDYERIVHAKAYRRLVDKAQIFTSAKGDHYRTRMTHTQEVAQIARAIARGLRLNVDLTEAIALAHDLGHTPFGHQGERTLDEILKNKIKLVDHFPEEKNYFGGFKHNFHGLRVVNVLEEKYVQFEGLDLSYQVLEGILKHTKVKLRDCPKCAKKDDCDLNCFDLKEFMPNEDIKPLYPDYPFATTLEGQVVFIADEIAQRSHDLDDSFSANILHSDELEKYLSLQKMTILKQKLEDISTEIRQALFDNRSFVDIEELRHSRIVSAVIEFFIHDVIQNSQETIRDYHEDEFYINEHRFGQKLIDFSNNGKVLCNYLEKIISKKVINDSEVVRFDNTAKRVVSELFKAYYENPKLLHKGTLRRIYIETRKHCDEVVDFSNGDLNVVRNEIFKITKVDFSTLKGQDANEYPLKKRILIRGIVDYIAGMTDSYAVSEYNKIYSAR